MSGIGGNSAGQVKAYIDRVEAVTQEIKEAQQARKEIYAEAKSNGFNVAALKVIVKQRAEDPEKRAAREADVALYLGVLADTPLGRSAVERAE